MNGLLVCYFVSGFWHSMSTSRTPSLLSVSAVRSFLLCRMLCCLNLLQLICPFFCGWAHGLFPVQGLLYAAVNILVHTCPPVSTHSFLLGWRNCWVTAQGHSELYSHCRAVFRSGWVFGALTSRDSSTSLTILGIVSLRNFSHSGELL